MAIIGVLLPAILLVFFQGAPANGDQVCSKGWTLKYDSCFKLFTEKRNWMYAQEDCEAHNGHLVMLKNKQVQDFVSKEIIRDSRKNVWIGVSDRICEGTFYWVDNSKVAYSNWDAGQPDNYNGQNCGYIWQNKNFRWDDADCVAQLEYVCQKEPAIFKK